METSSLYRSSRGIMEKNMETTIVGYIGLRISRFAAGFGVYGLRA